MKDNNLIKVPIKTVEKALISKLVAAGYSLVQAKLISDEFIENDLMGKSQFGVKIFSRIMEYDRKKTKKQIKSRITGSTISIDMGGRFVHTYINETIKFLTQRAKKDGISIAGIYNNTSLIKASYPVKKLVDAGYVGICFIFANGNYVSVPEIKSPIFGTNPFSVGVPAGRKSFVFDSTSSSVSMGTLNRMKLENIYNYSQPLGLDINNALTSIPSEVKTLLPLGGAKGLGLLMAIDFLAGSMLGYPLGSEKSEYAANNGALIICIDPSKFGDPKKFIRKNQKFISDLIELSNGRIHIPGQTYSLLQERSSSISMTKEIFNSIIT